MLVVDGDLCGNDCDRLRVFRELQKLQQWELFQLRQVADGSPMLRLNLDGADTTYFHYLEHDYD